MKCRLMKRGKIGFVDHSILYVEVVRECEKSSGDTASEIRRRLEIYRQAAAKITTKIAERDML